MKKNRKKEKLLPVKETVNQNILNIITPAGVEVDTSCANVGENYGKLYSITRYPQDADYGWLAPLCSLEGTSTTIEYRYTEPTRMIQVFNKKIKELKANRETTKEEADKQRLTAAIEDLEEMINRVAVANEPVGYVNIMLFIQAPTQQGLEMRLKRVSSAASIAGCNIKLLKFRQIQALTATAPYGVPNYEEVSNVGERNMPISTFVGGFPMAAAGLNDPEGYYLGKTLNNRLIILNHWLRNKDRVNSNWFITGLPGTGKSSFLKKLFLYEIALDRRIIVFDAEREYIDLAGDPDVEGEVIDCAGGTTGRINPLQIRSSPKPEEDEEWEADFYEKPDVISEMALHIQNLRAFFKLYLGEALTSGKRALLETLLIELYERFGITWDTDVSKISNDEFPIMSDLYDFGRDKLEMDKSLSERKKLLLEELLEDLQSCAHGADRFIWNGPTTLEARSHFTVLDTSNLLDADENVQNAQFFNMAMWGWHEMSRDRSEKVILAADEGYLFVDPQNPYLMKFFRNISKRDRKYESGLMFITHSVTDVLDPEVKRLGQALIDNACYKFFMGCDGKNLEELKNLFKLTEKEETLLASKTRGQGLLMAGSTRLVLKVEIWDKFLEKFGKAGGR